MSQSDAVKVFDLIRALTTSNPYQHLKDQLLRMYALTDHVCVEAISNLPLCRDMLPSALRSKRLALLPADHQACFFLRGAFLQCVFHLMSGPHLFMISSQTPFLWLSVPTRFTGVKFHPLPPCTMSPLPLVSVPFLLFELHLPPILAPRVLLHLVPATTILSHLF